MSRLGEHDEYWLNAQKALMSQHLFTEEGRERILVSILDPLRNLVTYATREMASDHDRGRVAVLVNLTDAVLSRCTGGEKYDRVALLSALGDAKSIAEGVDPKNPREAALVEWIRGASQQDQVGSLPSRRIPSREASCPAPGYEGSGKLGRRVPGPCWREWTAVVGECDQAEVQRAETWLELSEDERARLET